MALIGSSGTQTQEAVVTDDDEEQGQATTLIGKTTNEYRRATITNERRWTTTNKDEKEEMGTKWDKAKSKDKWRLKNKFWGKESWTRDTRGYFKHVVLDTKIAILQTCGSKPQT